MDCWKWISLAMSNGFVSMLLYMSVIQSSGGVSWLLKTFLCILFEIFSNICLYLDMDFLMQSWVNFVVIARA